MTQSRSTQISLSETPRNNWTPTNLPTNLIVELIRIDGCPVVPVQLFRYFEARFYDPLVGRFVSPDPLFASELKTNGKQMDIHKLKYTS